MTLDSDILIDRRRIKRSLTIWRVLAILAIVAAIAAFASVGSDSGASLFGIGRDHIARIVDIQMRRLAQLLGERKITVTLEPAARDWLANKGWDPAYGARPLKRVIQKSVQDPLAEMILAGTIKDGETVSVSAGKQGLTFNGKLAQAA